ncbi:MAG TPA: carboxypeptidase-like regulatory domain-containing protein, partial [Acidobacteriota bacterium]|nr:carboxypeptidase-like regulatory domain-containing protein [Acidobacteriota bacterium]
MNNGLIRLCVLSILLLFATVAASAQATDGGINGKVVDESGAVISGASVKVTNMETGFSSSATADASGLFRINYLPVGKYSISAEASGFKTTSIDNVGIALNSIIDVTIKMLPGEVSEVVTVSGGDVLVETSSSILGNTF